MANSSGWSGFSPHSADRIKMEDLVDLVPLKTGGRVKFTLRIISRPVCTKIYWFPATKKDGGTTNFPMFCQNYGMKDGKEGHDESIKCPVQKLATEEGVSSRVSYFVNVIVRELQDGEPRKPKPYSKSEMKSGFLSKASNSWRCVRVLEMPPTVMAQVMDEAMDNPVKGEIYYADHPRYGYDFTIVYNPNEAGSSKYKVTYKGVTPLTAAEKEYLPWNVEDAVEKVVGTMDNALQEVKRFRTRNEKTEDGKPSKKAKSRLDEDDEDDGIPQKGKSKKLPDYDDEDDDLDLEDSDDDEDDEDDRPAKSRNKSKVNPSKSKRRPADDDEDDDEDEDDEPPVRKKKPSVKSKVSSKTKPSSKVKPKRRVVDDDIDDDDIPF